MIKYITLHINFKVKIVSEPEPDPLTGQFFDYAEQDLVIEADNVQAAHLLADKLCTLNFRGQQRRTYLNGEEHLNENH